MQKKVKVKIKVKEKPPFLRSFNCFYRAYASSAYCNLFNKNLNLSDEPEGVKRCEECLESEIKWKKK